MSINNSLILESMWPRHNLIFRLPPIHSLRYTAMLTLTLVTSSRGLTLTRTRTSSPPDEFLVGIFEIVEGAEDASCSLRLSRKESALEQFSCG